MGWPGPMTHRQFIAWRSWQKQQWNNPSRTDYYLMQCAAESRLIPIAIGKMFGSKDNTTVKLDALKIPFEFKVIEIKAPPERTKETVSAHKSIWFAAVGGKTS